MSEVELPNDQAFETFRGLVHDLLMAHSDKVGPVHLDTDDEPTTAVEHPLLSDWVLLTSWIDTDDPKLGNRLYVKVTSQDCSAHAALGLIETFRD